MSEDRECVLVDDALVCGVGADEVETFLIRSAYGVPQIAACLSPVLACGSRQIIDEPLEEAFHNGTEQRGLAAEVVVDGSFGDARQLSDFVEAGEGVPGVGEEVLSGGQHRGSCVVRMFNAATDLDHTSSIEHTQGMASEVRATSEADTRRHVVISADGHVFGPGNGLMDTNHLGLLTEYFEPRYRSDYREYTKGLEHELKERMARVIGGLFDKNTPRSFAEHSGLSTPGTQGLFDSKCRLKDLEQDGIVAEVLFPNGVPFGHAFGGPVHLPELRTAGARAYNRWLADFCGEEPGRRAGMAVVTLHDIDQAVNEVHAAKDAGLKGVLLPNYWATEGIPPYLDPCYEPFWSACAATSMPLNVHGGASIGDVDMKRYGMPAMLTYATETTFLSTRALTQLIWGGVFQRYPDLVLILTESRADWVPSRLAFLDGVYEDQLFAHVKNTVKHKPSEYWHRQCYVTASFMSRDEALLRHKIGLDRLLWGADYPHYEGTWPHTDRWLRETFGGLPTAEVTTILAENPARLFGFDLERLARHAQAVGPPVDEVERYEPSGKLWRW